MTEAAYPNLALATHDVGQLAPPDATSLAEEIEALLPDLLEYVEGYAPTWNRAAVVELPQQALQANTHAILKTAYELLCAVRGELE